MLLLINMVTSQIATNIKKHLIGVDEYQMHKLMQHHYRLLNLIDENGNWATPEIQLISAELLPTDTTSEKIFLFIDKMASLAEKNLYLVDFLKKIENVRFGHLIQKSTLEGTLVYPGLVAYSMVLENLTRSAYDNPKILEQCVKIFKIARKEAGVSKHMFLFHKIKLLSVEYGINKCIKYHKTRIIPKSFGRWILAINILEAVIVDYIIGFKDNAKSGLVLAVHRTGSKVPRPLTGEGPTTWSDDKKAISMSLPMAQAWCDLYQTWNMAFVSMLKNFPYFLVKLLIPQVAGYQDNPRSYVYKRALALYFCLNHFSLDYVRKTKLNEPMMQWHDTNLSKIWGKTNLDSAKKYIQLLTSVTK